jgi:hypothetical protein
MQLSRRRVVNIDLFWLYVVIGVVIGYWWDHDGGAS